MVFPTQQRWKDLERSTKISLLLVVLIYLAVATVGYFKAGPNEKDRQVFAWASSTAEIGLLNTRAYNISSGGILTGAKWGDCEAYIMAPPLYHLLLAGIYALSGGQWQPLRLGTIFYGLVFLYACLALAVKFFRGAQRNWLLFFALTPMMLIFSVWNDTYGTPMGILVLAYLCLVNNLERGKLRRAVWSGVQYMLSFWHSYISISVVPAILLQTLLHPGLTRRERLSGGAIFVLFVGLAGLVSLVHIAALPEAVEWFFARLGTRFSNVRPGEDPGVRYSLVDFLTRQAIRFTTHFTPISLFLAGWAMILALFKLLLRKIPLQPGEAGHFSVDPLVVVLVLFTWGVPMQLGIQVAYIHPLMMYYFVTFFAFASVVGLALLSTQFKFPSLRKGFVIATLVLFTLMSVGRSVYNLRGGSLYDLAKGVKSEKAELFTIEELLQFTCMDLGLKEDNE